LINIGKKELGHSAILAIESFFAPSFLILLVEIMAMDRHEGTWPI
jgi:hypothetical protein